MAEADLARLRQGPAADKCDIGESVVGATERPDRHDTVFKGQRPHNGMDFGYL